jgi:HSP20 family protein
MMPGSRRPSLPSLWDDPLASVEERLNRLMGRLWEDRTGEGLAAYPVDIHEDNYNIYVEAELPGFKKEEIDVNYEAGVLTITAQRKPPLREGCQQHVSERRFSRIQRRFTLPASVDENNVTARLEDGVLYIALKKREETQRKKIDII